MKRSYKSTILIWCNGSAGLTQGLLPKSDNVLPFFRYFDLRLLWLPYDPQDEPL